MSTFEVWKFDISPSWSYIYQDCLSCTSLIRMRSTMAPRDLLQDTIDYNRKVNLARRMMKSTKYSPPTLPFMSAWPLQPEVSTNVPIKSVKVIRRHVVPCGANKRLWMSRNHKDTQHTCNHAIYTPMVELRCNNETVLSWLQPVIVKASKVDIRQKNRQINSAPDPSELPSTRYRVPSGFVDELLDGLVISDRTTGYRSSLRSAPDCQTQSTESLRVLLTRCWTVL